MGDCSTGILGNVANLEGQQVGPFEITCGPAWFSSSYLMATVKWVGFIKMKSAFGNRANAIVLSDVALLVASCP
jgi:hypothetical protein